MRWIGVKRMKTVKKYLPVVFSLIVFGTCHLNQAAEAQEQYPRDARRYGLEHGSVRQIYFKSKIDGSDQYFLLQTPVDYQPTHPWPLLVTLHGLNDGPILAPIDRSMVQIGPYGRGSVWYEGIGAKDVFECIETVKRMIPIDEDRIYLCGFSMGGDAAFNLGLHTPDRWAACMPVCGKYDEIDAVSNGRYLPYAIHVGGKDTVRPPACCKPGYLRACESGFGSWTYTQYDEMGHSFWVDWTGAAKWLLSQTRVKNPPQVTFGTVDLNYNKAYWVEILSLEKYGRRGTVNASITKQTVQVTTNNVDGYRLKLEKPLLDPSQPVTIIENGREVFKGKVNSDGWFIHNPNRKSLDKKTGLCGPLWDIYSEPSILVCPTGGNSPEMNEAAERCASSFLKPKWMSEVSFKTVLDVDLTEEDIKSNNLVLFGNAETNCVLSLMADRLPVQMKGKTITARNKTITGKKIGFVLIYPNPLNPEKYVAVFSGCDPESVNCFGKIWPAYFPDVPKMIDVGVFELLPNDIVDWKLKGIFGSHWEWQD